MARWVTQARNIREMWSDDAQDYFYYDETTGESEWEPSRLGYTRHDGKLILESGECVIDPEVSDGYNLILTLTNPYQQP